jgi:hypothetical protein
MGETPMSNPSNASAATVLAHVDHTEVLPVPILPMSVREDALRLARQSRGVPIRRLRLSGQVRKVVNGFLEVGNGDVLIHHDHAACAAAALLGAHAFCYHGRVFLGPTIDTPVGPTLAQALAHELVHVAQVCGALRTGRVDSMPEVEREALRLAGGAKTSFDVRCGASPDECYGWSSHGHAELTSLGLAAAFADLVGFGYTYFFKQAAKYYSWLYSYGQTSGGMAISDGANAGIDQAFTEHYDPTLTSSDIDGTNTRRDVAAAVPNSPVANFDIAKLLVDLPAIVVNEDVHLGNIPGHGETFEPGRSQVRHFMRSNESISSTEALYASREYMQDHLVKSWTSFAEALRDPHGFWENVGNLFADSQGGRGFAFRDARKNLGAALHTIQDSYAPGHVERMFGTEIIVRVNIWDKDNQDADPSRNWDGHHAYDEPENKTAKPHYWSARLATAECIFTVLSNLGQSEEVARAAITGFVSRVTGASITPDQPTRPPTSLPA